MAKLNVRVIVGVVFAPVGLLLLGVAAALAVSSAGFTHVDPSLGATYPDGVVRWVATEIITPSQ